MSAFCVSCRKRLEKVKKLKGKCPLCGYYNSLVKMPKVRKEKTK